MEPIETLIKAIKRIKEPRLFNSERGYQGQLKSELDRLLEVRDPQFDHPLVEEEYQKSAEHHGINLRPDIIIHIPFDRGVSPTRKHDNFLVILLKLAANEIKAFENFEALETICSGLNYPIGVAVNVRSNRLFLQKYAAKRKGPYRLVEVAVDLVEGRPVICDITRTIP